MRDNLTRGVLPTAESTPSFIAPPGAAAPGQGFRRVPRTNEDCNLRREVKARSGNGSNRVKRLVELEDLNGRVRVGKATALYAELVDATSESRWKWAGV
jgi:hypothetical protein